MSPEQSGRPTVAPTDLSRAISSALRHEPWRYELELDDEGWVELDDLLAALAIKGGVWRHVTRSDVEEMIATSAKVRHELLGSRIRARYGHSVSGILAKRPGTPPPTLFHGTSPEAAQVILTEGLRGMRRNYVHLSANREIAVEVGRRKSGTPVMLLIDTAAATAAGAAFFEGNGLVWLADHIPPEAIRTEG